MNEEEIPLIPNDVETAEPSQPSKFAEFTSKVQKMLFSGASVYKILYPLSLLVSLMFTLSGPFLNKYFVLKGGQLNIPIHNSENSLSFDVASAVLGSQELNLVADGVSEVIPYAPGQPPLDGPDFEVFVHQIIGMNYTEVAFQAIDALAYMLMGLTGIAFLIQVVYREFPTTLSFKAGSTFKQDWKRATPVWLIFICFGFSIIRLLLVTSFVQSLSTRVAIYSVKTGMDTVEWEKFISAIKSDKQYELSVLLALAAWFESVGATWSYSAYSILSGILLNLCIFITIFYLDTRTIRFELQMETSQLQAVQLLRNKLKLLPFHCRIIPLSMSISSFIASLVATKISGMMAFNSGLALNRLPWDSFSPSSTDHLIDDLVVSRADGYWFNPPSIVDGTVLGWIPMILVVLIGSITRIECLSKIIEVLAYGYWIRTISIYVTSFPTSMAVLQSPQCYDLQRMSIFKAMMSNEFCNDMMYSGHATMVFTPAFTMILMLIHGPFNQKMLTLGVILVCMAFSSSVVIIGRFHYTADVLVSCIICFTLCIIHSPAWKIMFTYRKFELGIGSRESIHKVIPVMEEVGVRIVSLTKGRRIDYQLTNWDDMDRKQENIKEFINKLDPVLHPPKKPVEPPPPPPQAPVPIPVSPPKATPGASTPPPKGRGTTPPPKASGKTTTPPPEDRDKRSTPPPRGRDKRTTPPPKGRDRGETPPPKGRDRGETPPPKGRDKGGTPPPKGRDRGGTPPPKGRDRGETPPPKGRDKGGTPPPKDRKRGGTPPPRRRG
jgi:hypothetical protein